MADNKGFSFLELVMALGFLAIIMTPLYNFLSTIGSYNTDHVNRSEALLIASSKLEETCAKSFEKLLPFETEPQLINGTYLSSTSITYMDTNSTSQITGPSPFKLVTVQISWHSSTAASENILLSRVISE